jgi:hypothetical protein
MAVHNILNLAGPPRDVPLSVRLRVLLGGFLNQFGWFFFGFGLVFVWAFTVNADLTSWYRFRGHLDTAQGKVLYSEKTKFSAEGMRRKPIGFAGLIPVLFPVFGLLLISGGIKKGIKANRLLALGEQTTGRLKSKEKTNTKVNKKPVYKLTFEFNTSEGMTYEATAKTHDTAKLEDQTQEPLLYDPMRPYYAVMLDDLPGNPRIMENGNIHAGRAANTIKVLVIPLVTIIGHSIYIYLKFLS